MIMQSLLLLLLVAGTSHPAFAGPVEVQSIKIVPAEAIVGSNLEITGEVKAPKFRSPGRILKIVVVAELGRPDHVVKSWTWNKVSMRSGEIRSFTIPKKFEIKLAGTYKVDFIVYSKDMKPLHSLSKKVVVVDQTLKPEKAITPVEDKSHLERASGQAAGRQPKSPIFGVGLYADTVHSSGGATMFLWPFKYVGLQASYSEGSFTIAEGRILARFPFSSGISPYLGAGFLNVSTERSVEIVGIKTRFQDSGMSGVIGVEMLLGKRVFGCVEVSSSSIDLKKEVSSGAVTGTASVKYAPVTIGINIGYFLF